MHLDSAAVHDLTAAEPTLRSIQVPRGRGWPRTQPGGLAADRGYDRCAFRDSLARRGIRHSVPTRPLPPGHRRQRRFRTQADLSAHRWKVERFFAQLNGFRRLGVRFERFSDIYLGFLHLAAIMICLRRLLQ
ncbi:MAG: transposase [Verrucomicrobia bacterium]|nr:transposase [Verrucomicrobiota bacterium]